ncbi:MAG: cytochrome c peroxidase [Arcticibacterium sp.]|jgi:cytochrome c peroxidase
MNMKKLDFISLITLTVDTLSCNTPDKVISASDLDLSLEVTLRNSSGGTGKPFYKLPKSTDLASIPQDPLNPLTKAKVELGKLLFHETGIAQNPQKGIGMNTYSCASCHHARAGFQACLPQGIGEGGLGFGSNGEGRQKNSAYTKNEMDVQPIRTPSAINLAYQEAVLWNGQFGGTSVNLSTEANWQSHGHPTETNKLGFEGIESQAIAGIKVHRLLIDRIFMRSVGNYQSFYEQAFPPSSFNNPQKLNKNGALAIAAYERTLLANESPFQLWLKGYYGALTDDEKNGANIFFGKGKCASCHNGPSLANMEFHALGMNDLSNGLYEGKEVVNVAINDRVHKGRGGFTKVVTDMFKFKVPQLYNLMDSPFYGHGASFTSIRDVIEYKNKAIPENINVSSAQLDPSFIALNLTSEEIDLITLFLKHGLYDPNLDRYTPERLPSGLAFPNNDPQTRSDLGF